jgi:CDP-diacylglycerol---glycerol-3-phosphate 3-phosphatidyltransferase
MFDGNFRSQIEAGLRPVGNSLKRVGVTADALTAVGVVMAVGSAVAIGAGAFSLALLLLVLTGLPDLLDGAVAKAWGTTSKRGAFFDSVSDRLSDGLMFGGVAWYLAATDGRPWVVMVPVAAYISASLVSYIRAKADALGFDARGGLVERAERVILLALGLLFSQYLVWFVALILVLNVITAGQRFVKVWRQGTDEAPALSDRRRRRSRRTTSPRWATRPASARGAARRGPR